MQKLLLALCVLVAASTLHAQRYLAQSFAPSVDLTAELTPYGANVSVLPIVLGQSMEPALDTLGFRLYTPAGDVATNRPVVIIHHTGSYMPLVINGGLTGMINDLAVIELGQRFAALGYVVVTPEYRLGWNTTAPDVDEQTETLLIASLRGAQDLHMMTRFLRKTVAEDGNPLGIDAERIMALGLGTGGYNVNNANFLDRVSEVNDLDKFIDSRDNLPYYDSTLYGNPYGTDQARLNVPNWAQYESGFAFGVNLGGAMGDVSWIEGKDSEAPVVAMHSIRDANAPFGIGNILVPTTGNTVLQDSPGSRVIVGMSNMNGNNAPLEAINAQLLAAGDGLTARVAALSDVPFTTRSGFMTTLATENLYPFVYPEGTRFANEYNYADTSLIGPVARPIIAGIPGFPFPNFESMVQAEQASNRNFLDPAGARAYLDTIMQFVVPRAYAALNLQELVGTEDLSAATAELEVMPNPARDRVVVEVREDLAIERVEVFSSVGQRVGAFPARGSRVEVPLDGVPAGVHFLFIHTDEGVTTSKLYVE